MNEFKKSTKRKDFYKYQRSSYPRNIHNYSNVKYYKHSKYKYKYNYSNSSNKFDEEPIFKKIFGEKNYETNNYKKYYEKDFTPIPNKFDNKENICFNSNIYDTRTKMKTKDEGDISENNLDENEDENNSIPFTAKDSEDFLMEEKDNNEEKQENEEKEKEIGGKIEKIEDFNKINNINFNENGNNFNIENIINDLLTTNNDFNLMSNEKDIIILDNKKDVNQSSQRVNLNSSNTFNIMKNNNINNAFNFHRNLDSLYSKDSSQVPKLFTRKSNSLNDFNLLSDIQKPLTFSSDKHCNNFNNFGSGNNNNINYSNNNIQRNLVSFNINSFKIPPSLNLPISSFNLTESNINNIPNLSRFLSSNENLFPNINKNPFNNMLPKLELNKCILKTQINNNNLFERKKENTDILEINVKVSKTKTLKFKIRRYDDMFRTVKIFCEINKLDINLMRPFIIYIIRALNTIYGIYNLSLKENEIEFLKELKRKYYCDDNSINKDIKDNNEEDEKNVNENNIYDS